MNKILTLIIMFASLSCTRDDNNECERDFYTEQMNYYFSKSIEVSDGFIRTIRTNKDSAKYYNQIGNIYREEYTRFYNLKYPEAK